MKTSYKSIKKTLIERWPKLRDIWLTDRTYWVPTKEELEEALSLTKTHLQEFIPGISECNHFALQLHAEMTRLRYLSAVYRKIPKEEWFTWAFGQVMGLEFKGNRMNHAVNLCLTIDGLYFIEPQDNSMWLADPDKSDIYFVRM